MAGTSPSRVVQLLCKPIALVCAALAGRDLLDSEFQTIEQAVAALVSAAAPILGVLFSLGVDLLIHRWKTGGVMVPAGEKTALKRATESKGLNSSALRCVALLALLPLIGVMVGACASDGGASATHTNDKLVSRGKKSNTLRWTPDQLTLDSNTMVGVLEMLGDDEPARAPIAEELTEDTEVDETLEGEEGERTATRRTRGGLNAMFPGDMTGYRGRVGEMVTSTDFDAAEEIDYGPPQVVEFPDGSFELVHPVTKRTSRVGSKGSTLRTEEAKRLAVQATIEQSMDARAVQQFKDAAEAIKDSFPTAANALIQIAELFAPVPTP